MSNILFTLLFMSNFVSEGQCGLLKSYFNISWKRLLALRIRKRSVRCPWTPASNCHRFIASKFDNTHVHVLTLMGYSLFNVCVSLVFKTAVLPQLILRFLVIPRRKDVSTRFPKGSSLYKENLSCDDLLCLFPPFLLPARDACAVHDPQCSAVDASLYICFDVAAHHTLRF